MGSAIGGGLSLAPEGEVVGTLGFEVAAIPDAGLWRSLRAEQGPGLCELSSRDELRIPVQLLLQA